MADNGALQEKGLFQVAMTREFPVSTDALWKALTDCDQMRKWYFPDIPGFRPEVGFSTEFTVESGGREFPHVWQVLAVDPGKSLTHSWQYRGYPGAATLTLAVSDVDSGARLDLTFDVVEAFPDDIPEFTRQSCQGGWDYFIGESLPAYLTGSS